MVIELLDCTVTYCLKWKSANTTAPEAGYCTDKRVISCHRRSKAKGWKIPFKLGDADNGVS